MRNKKKLLVEQLDTKLEPFFSTTGIVIPPRGWINAVRTAINMTMAQLGSKLDITKQGVKGIEDSEAAGTISLKTLNEAAEALDLKLVYALVPKDGSFENLIDKNARRLAEKLF